MQRAYNVTLSGIHETIVVCMCVCVCVCVDVGASVCLRGCSLTNPAFNALPFCHPRPLLLHHIFRHCLMKGTIFGGGGKDLT
jgi:hypothetical protein